jgi:hypothetical protein
MRESDIRPRPAAERSRGLSVTTVERRRAARRYPILYRII